MSLRDILDQYQHVTTESSATSAAHYDEVAKALPPSELARGVTETLRSDRTPPFPDMVSGLFTQSSPGQQAGILNQIVGGLAPGAWSSLGSGLLGRLFGSKDPAKAVWPVLTPEQAGQFSANEVREIAGHDENQNPGIVAKAGAFYAQHPDLIKGIGAMGLAVLLGKLAHR